ncbi:unnamed protein product [Pieris brassicae]|uniref:Uncharacterized protein n=1 Tax=Pieris brassicae TaxID=7116 RepID=A0A9P0TLQ7_PIEBR|nr:unnamed protein product [Pieris brassicae]
MKAQPTTLMPSLLNWTSLDTDTKICLCTHISRNTVTTQNIPFIGSSTFNTSHIDIHISIHISFCRLQSACAHDNVREPCLVFISVFVGSVHLSVFTMCYKGQCLHCIEVETGSLIWAIINVILTGLACLICIGILICLNVMVIKDVDFEAQMNGYAVVVNGLYNLICMVALTFSAIDFMFSMFLLVGVIKKHVGYVKAYYFYGLVKIIITSLGLIGVLTEIDYYAAFFVNLSVYVFHYLVLQMVRNTYLKFNEGSIIQQFMHKPLV